MLRAAHRSPPPAFATADVIPLPFTTYLTHYVAAAATCSHAAVGGSSQLRGSAAYAQFLLSASATNKFTADCQSSAEGYAELMTTARSVDPSACWVELRTENDHKVVGCTVFAEISQGTTCYHNYYNKFEYRLAIAWDHIPAQR